MLFLDEPFAGVDPIAVQHLAQILERMSHEGYGIMISDHNVQTMLSLVRECRTYGEMVKSGTSAEIAADPMM